MRWGWGFLGSAGSVEKCWLYVNRICCQGGSGGFEGVFVKEIGEVIGGKLGWWGGGKGVGISEGAEVFIFGCVFVGGDVNFEGGCEEEGVEGKGFKGI